MRFQLLLPAVDPKHLMPPTKCVSPSCASKGFRLYQPVQKAVRDTVYQQVEAHRYQCLKCGRTFRVYPAGVTAAHMSQRVKGLAVLLYLLGLSYRAVSLALAALGVAMSKTHVYNTVQQAARGVRSYHLMRNHACVPGQQMQRDSRRCSLPPKRQVLLYFSSLSIDRTTLEAGQAPMRSKPRDIYP